MAMFKWELGRQGGKYKKMALIINKHVLPFDVYILKFPSGSSIKQHVDPSPDNRRHFRLNIVLKRAKVGGRFKCPQGKQWWRLQFFRPDLYPHSQTQVQKGTKYYLSIGWLFGKDPQ